MKTNVRDSSLDAYSELKKGKLGNQQQTILNHLTHGRDYSLREIQQLTGLEINVVSGRCNDLKKLNLLWEMPKRKCSISDKLIIALALPQQQKELF